MSKTETMIPRGLNVISILSFLISLTTFSQTKIEGVFFKKDKFNDFKTSYTFKDSIFEYEHNGDVGAIEYGKGTCFLKRDSLELHYNKTNLSYDSYHKKKLFINDKESVKFEILVKDFNGNPIKNVNVFNLKEKFGEITNEEGKAEFVFNKLNKNIEVTFSFLGYKELKVILNKSYNYIVEVFLSEGDLIPIRNQVEKYKIIEANQHYLKLHGQRGLTILLKDN